MRSPLVYDNHIHAPSSGDDSDLSIQSLNMIVSLIVSLISVLSPLSAHSEYDRVSHAVENHVLGLEIRG
jgi:hypothetical protein